MSIVGTFVLESNSNYDAWLQKVGVPTELAAKMCAAKPKVEVIKTGDGLKVITTAGDKIFENVIVFNKDSITDIAGLKYTINVNETAKGYSGTIILANKSGTVLVEGTDTGFMQTIEVEGVVAKRTFTRQ